uniref:Uncharacterized protein n=1 Tax=Plectus sambesii TaxID=2011161 RepID=A0A914W6K8_9BILA
MELDYKNPKADWEFRAAERVDWCSGQNQNSSIPRTRVQFSLRSTPHPTKVLIPPWVGELVAASLRKLHIVNIPVTGMRRPTGNSTVAIHTGGFSNPPAKSGHCESSTNA